MLIIAQGVSMSLEFESTDKTIWHCGIKMRKSLRYHNGSGYYILLNTQYKQIFSVYPVDKSEKTFTVYYYHGESMLDGIETLEMSGETPVYLPKKLGYN